VVGLDDSDVQTDHDGDHQQTIENGEAHGLFLLGALLTLLDAVA
jgi:hypothetical protein